MKKTAPTRIAGDLCFCFAILNAFPAFRQWQLPMAAFVLAAFLVSLAAVRLENRVLRLLLALLPALCFIGVRPHPLLIFPALAWLYLILVLTMGTFEVHLYNYRNTYLVMAVVCLFFVTASAANATLFRGELISLDSLVYLALFLVLGVISMRSMQMGAAMDLRWRLANALSIVAALLLAVSVSLVLYGLIVKSLPVVSYLFAPLGQLLVWIVSLFIRNDPAETAPLTPEYGVSGVPSSALLESGAAETAEAAEEGGRMIRFFSDDALTAGGWIAVVLLAALAVWIIVRLARRGSALPLAEDLAYDDTEAGKPRRRQRGRKEPAPAGPAEQVRRVYRDYLAFLEENGLRREASDTSEQILKESEHRAAVEVKHAGTGSAAAGNAGTGSAAAATVEPSGQTSYEARLREIYLKARYSEASVTAQDAAEAKALLDAIRRGRAGKK